MERDKKGRFVKKGLGGLSISPPLNLSLSNSDKISLSNPLGNKKIKYTIYNDGKFYDQFGKEISLAERAANPNKYEFDSNLNPIFIKTETNTGTGTGKGESSGGVNIFDSIKNGISNLASKPINKEKLANWLDLANAGIAAGINNKIANRALEAEKPFLQDVSESHRSVYGDYRSKIEGEKQAAQLRNLASKPLISDGAVQQQMMLDAQIKGNEYINQGNAQDESMIKQTREVAWQQEKENQQQRQAAAMQNRQAMMMSEKNKANIENIRDSANYSQVIQPLLTGITSRIRQNAAEQDAYQEYYDNALIGQRVWSDTEGLTPDQIEMQNHYLNGTIDTYLEEHPDKETAFRELESKKSNRILQERAALKGVNLNIDWNQNKFSNPYGFNWEDENMFKQGGTIYKARLTKRISDNNRSAKSIESNKKIAARFLEKALNSLYTYNDVELIAKPKNKKKKYQAGGSLPFVSFTPTFATSEKGASISQKSEDKDDLTTKDILELLKDMDGLPSDMAQILGSLQNFTMKDSLDPLGLSSSSNIASQYMKIINKIKVAKFHRDEYNNAFNQLKGNGGLNEFAVTSEGLLIGSNKEGNFEYFTPEQINAGEHKNQGYSLLTNSNLLYLRANSPNAAFNHYLTTVAQNGIGMEVITKQVNDILSNLGSSKESEEGFIKMGNSGQIKNGLQFLQKAAQEIGDASITDNMSVADYYQAGYLTEEQANQAQLALQYIWSALPANAQSLLQIKGGGMKGAEAIIQSLVYSKTSTESQFKATPKKMSKTGSGSSGSDDIDKLNLSPVQMMQVGYTDHQQVVLQKGTKYATVVNAQVLPITDVNKKLLGVTTLDRVAESTFGGALDMNNVTMGSQLIDPHALQNVQVDSTNLYVMNLPIDKNSIDGTVKPDLSWMSKIEEIDKIIREHGITDIAQINKLYVEAGLPVLMDDNGQLNIQDYCKFGVLNGHALNSAFKDIDLLDNTILEIDDENTIENVLNILNKGRSEKDRVNFDSESWADSIFGTKHDSLYEGTIYIPIRTNAFTGMIGGGQYPTTETAEEIEALIQQKERTRGYIDPGLLT